MKKPAILCVLCISFLISNSQDSTETRLVGDTLITNVGFKIVENQELTIGTGGMPDGDFKFIRISSTSMFQYTSNNGNNTGKNQANALTRSASGKHYKVVRIDKRGSKKRGYSFYPIINVGATRYEVDIDNAVASGEIKVPDQFLPKKESPVVVVKQEISVADELTKLKKLYDDGVLTKEEYDAQKKKLLEKQ